MTQSCAGQSNCVRVEEFTASTVSFSIPKIIYLRSKYQVHMSQKLIAAISTYISLSEKDCDLIQTLFQKIVLEKISAG
jgi:hypothetical protein